MQQKVVAFLLLGLCLILLAAAVVVGVWFFGGMDEKQGDGSQQAAAAQAEAAPVQEKTDTEPGGEKGEDSGSTAERALRNRESAELQQQPRPAEASYFADAAFVVNSVSRGLDLYDYDGLLASADFYGADDLSAFGMMEYIRQLEGKDYGKVYIGLGINELSNDAETVQACYESMLSELLTYDPECIVVLMSVPPVSEYKSSSDDDYAIKLVEEYNAMLLELAETWDVWYLDVCSVLSNEEGYLPSEVNEDGIHFTPAHYSAWFERLSTHYVNDGTVSQAPLPTESPAPAE